MKKILSIALAIVMVLSLGVCAFADGGKTDVVSNTDVTLENTNKVEWDSTDNITESTGDVDITVDAYEAADAVYYVVVGWESLVFTYDAGSQGTWSPEEHKYNNATEGTWTDNTAKITVTNHSNASVTSAASYVKADPENDQVNFAIECNVNSQTLSSAEANEDFTDAPSLYYTVTASGEPTVSYTNYCTITITITAA